ncbi:MAG: hypothetical protein M3P51_00705 [Chloroflexota bacterium]|nr:hypothetical protein [Chloroflexota bacterium]
MTELKHSRTYDHGFAIVRVDTFHDMSETTDFWNVIKVKVVVNTAERAQAEVERLNALNGGKGSVYFWQVTRLERS